MSGVAGRQPNIQENVSWPSPSVPIAANQESIKSFRHPAMNNPGSAARGSMLLIAITAVMYMAYSQSISLVKADRSSLWKDANNGLIGHRADA